MRTYGGAKIKRKIGRRITASRQIWDARIKDTQYDSVSSKYFVRLYLAGTDELLWGIVGAPDEEGQQFLQWFCYQRESSRRPVPASRIPPQVGHIERYAAMGQRLYVFYDKGSLYRYEPSGLRRDEPPGLRR